MILWRQAITMETSQFNIPKKKAPSVGLLSQSRYRDLPRTFVTECIEILWTSWNILSLTKVVQQQIAWKHTSSYSKWRVYTVMHCCLFASQSRRKRIKLYIKRDDNSFSVENAAGIRRPPPFYSSFKPCSK